MNNEINLIIVGKYPAIKYIMNKNIKVDFDEYLNDIDISLLKFPDKKEYYYVIWRKNYNNIEIVKIINKFDNIINYKWDENIDSNYCENLLKKINNNSIISNHYQINSYSKALLVIFCLILLIFIFILNHIL